MEKETNPQNPDNFNEYVAVIVAARLARKINDKRYALKQQIPLEEFTKIDQRKATSVAIDQFKKGEIKYSSGKPIESEDESFEIT
jgi:hypothetical protein